jgi:hypothetical protein
VREPIFEDVLKEIQATVLHLERAPTFPVIVAIAAWTTSVECVQDNAYGLLSEPVQIHELLTYKQFVCSPQHDNWCAAMEDKLASLH